MEAPKEYGGGGGNRTHVQESSNILSFTRLSGFRTSKLLRSPVKRAHHLFLRNKKLFASFGE